MPRGSAAAAGPTLSVVRFRSPTRLADGLGEKGSLGACRFAPAGSAASSAARPTSRDTRPRWVPRAAGTYWAPGGFGIPYDVPTVGDRSRRSSKGGRRGPNLDAFLMRRPPVLITP